MRLSNDQIKLQVRHSMRGPRKSVRWCGICGAKHAGICDLMYTGHGTYARPDRVPDAERQHKERHPDV